MKEEIIVEDLSKEFKVPKKIENPTFMQKLGSVFYRKWNTVQVLHDINFKINKGEFVGYVGPNGAGKSTTIKILTGVLTPSSGRVEVLGYVPHKQRYKYTYNIGVVFGHRSLLEFDIPAVDSFRLYKAIYELEKEEFNERLELFSRILKINELMHIPVRKLSLGQRMRCEIAASLLHKPKIVFLDEPTIGLDASAKDEIRNFLTKINKKEKTTIILTTHDMDDIEALCRRLIIIDKGRIIYDGDIKEVKKKYITEKTVEFDIEEIKEQSKFSELMKKFNCQKTRKHYKLKIPINNFDIPNVVEKILRYSSVTDLLVHEPRLENVIKEIYASGEAKHQH